MLPSHHLFRQPPWEYVQHVRLGLLHNRTEVLHREQCVTTPLGRRNLKEPVQTVERVLLHPVHQFSHFILVCTQESKICQQPNNADLNSQIMAKTGSHLVIPRTFNDWLGANGLFGCIAKPAHTPLTNTCPLAAPLVESGRLVTNYKDGGQATKLKMSLFTFLIK